LRRLPALSCPPLPGQPVFDDHRKGHLSSALLWRHSSWGALKRGLSVRLGSLLPRGCHPVGPP
ncbi:hypothetical protein LEMLEM_LOCUS3853, partial [Lemmus lemmus]